MKQLRRKHEMNLLVILSQQFVEPNTTWIFCKTLCQNHFPMMYNEQEFPFDYGY